MVEGLTTAELRKYRRGYLPICEEDTKFTDVPFQGCCKGIAVPALLLSPSGQMANASQDEPQRRLSWNHRLKTWQSFYICLRRVCIEISSKLGTLCMNSRSGFVKESPVFTWTYWESPLRLKLWNSMEQSLSETDSHSASQEITRPVWNPKFLYRVHRSPPLVSILSQTHLTPIFT
jgi:hypothetical protein